MGSCVYPFLDTTLATHFMSLVCTIYFDHTFAVLFSPQSRISSIVPSKDNIQEDFLYQVYALITDNVRRIQSPKPIGHVSEKSVAILIIGLSSLDREQASELESDRAATKLFHPYTFRSLVFDSLFSRNNLERGAESDECPCPRDRDGEACCRLLWIMVAG